jgi:hypothetical protein
MSMTLCAQRSASSWRHGSATVIWPGAVRSTSALQDRSYGVDQIRNSISPMLLPANRVLVDDGTLVSIGTPLAATILACGCITAQPHRQYQDVETEGGVRRAWQNRSLCQGVGHCVVESQ